MRIRSSRVAPSGSTRCTAGSTTTSSASPTGSTTEPAVTIENEKDVWGNYADWPIPGTQNVDVFLRSTGAATAGNLAGQAASVGATPTLDFTATAVEREHADQQPVGLAGQPPRVPLEPAQERHPPVRHRVRRPRRRAGRDGDRGQPERDDRRPRRRHAGVAHERRRDAGHAPPPAGASARSATRARARRSARRARRPTTTSRPSRRSRTPATSTRSSRRRTSRPGA